MIRDLKTVIFVLTNLGFHINWEKTVIRPSQEMKYLEFLINTLQMMISLPEDI